MAQKQKRKYITKKIREHRIFLFKLSSFCVTLIAIGMATFSAALLFRGGLDDLYVAPALTACFLAITSIFIILIGRLKNRGAIGLIWVFWPIIVTIFSAIVALLVLISSSVAVFRRGELEADYEPLIAGSYNCAVTDEDVASGVLDYYFMLGQTGDFKTSDKKLNHSASGKYAISNRRSDTEGIYYELRVIIGENSADDKLDSTRYELGSKVNGGIEIKDMENDVIYKCVKK